LDTGDGGGHAEEEMGGEKVVEGWGEEGLGGFGTGDAARDEKAAYGGRAVKL